MKKMKELMMSPKKEKEAVEGEQKVKERNSDDDDDDQECGLGNFGREGGIVTAVRVRPLNAREEEEKSRIVVSSPSFVSQDIVLLNPIFFKSSNQSEKLRKLEERCFSFDHTFWSLDVTDGVEAEYADQLHVYKKIGRPMIQNALSGFNSSLFAYGQTGSGKTYTMMGCEGVDTIDSDKHDNTDSDKADKGIIPRLCHELLDEVNSLKTHSEQHGEKVVEVFMRAAYYEIYNEKLYDLLCSEYDTPRKIREHSQEGAYVEGLTYKLIQSFDDIRSILAEGQEKRKTAETKMNAQSSRSHAIFVIELYQKLKISKPLTEGKKEEKKSDRNSSLEKQKSNNVKKKETEGAFNETIERKSKICLIDLAGSERVNLTGATGDLLKEATNINSSLSTLGDVIRKLSDAGKQKLSAAQDASSVQPSHAAVHVPYRNSVLTWILKDSLGGNSKTAILATISPSDLAYAESLSTLRYLERAKYIETNAVINENNSQDPYIKHLQHQLSVYKAKLNKALAKNREQETNHKTELDSLLKKLEELKSSSESNCDGFDTTCSNDDDLTIVEHSSSDELAVTLESEGDIVSLLRSNGSSSKDALDEETIRAGGLSRKPSRFRVRETKGRTKEYFENECYDLQDALVKSMTECNELRQRMAEMEELHAIDIEILKGEMQSRGCILEEDQSFDAVKASTSHEGASVLDASMEMLRLSLEEKENELQLQRKLHSELQDRADDERAQLDEVKTSLQGLRAENDRLTTTCQDLEQQRVSDAAELVELQRVVEAQRKELALREELLAGLEPVTDKTLTDDSDLDMPVPQGGTPAQENDNEGNGGGDGGSNDENEDTGGNNNGEGCSEFDGWSAELLIDQISSLRQELSNETAMRQEAQSTTVEASELLSLCSSKIDAYFAPSAEDGGSRETSLSGKIEQLLSTLEVASRKAEESEAYLHEWRGERNDLEAEVQSLKERLSDSEEYLNDIIADSEQRESGWHEREDEYERVLQKLNHEVDVLEVELSTKNTCLELFESQLAQQEKQQKDAIAKHEEVEHALRVEAEVTSIYLAAKEEAVEALQEQLAEKDEEISRLSGEKNLIEEGLTIELESFKLALGRKEESCRKLEEKLEKALEKALLQSDGATASTNMEIEILKQEINEKDKVMRQNQNKLERLEEQKKGLEERLADKISDADRLRSDLHQLKRDLRDKAMDLERSQEEHNRSVDGLNEQISKLQHELDSRRQLDSTGPKSKSKFICF